MGLAKSNLRFSMVEKFAVLQNESEVNIPHPLDAVKRILPVFLCTDAESQSFSESDTGQVVLLSDFQ